MLERPMMTSSVARMLADTVRDGDLTPDLRVSSDTFTKEFQNDSEELQFMQSSASSYTLANDRSQFSRDIDRWMSGSASPTETTGVQGSRVPLVQRSVLARSSILDQSGLWYAVALVLPLFTVNGSRHWRCTPSMVINTAELVLNHLSRVCSRARAHIRQLARDQVARELFATAMDILLVVYAIGFLVLSMYQASVFR